MSCSKGKPMLPPQYRQEEPMTNQELQTLNDQADKKGMLLPVHLRTHRASNKGAYSPDKDRMLLPPGIDIHDDTQ